MVSALPIAFFTDEIGMARKTTLGHRVARCLQQTIRICGVAGGICAASCQLALAVDSTLPAHGFQQTFPVAPFLRLTLDASLPPRILTAPEPPQWQRESEYQARLYEATRRDGLVPESPSTPDTASQPLDRAPAELRGGIPQLSVPESLPDEGPIMVPDSGRGPTSDAPLDGQELTGEFVELNGATARPPLEVVNTHVRSKKAAAEEMPRTAVNSLPPEAATASVSHSAQQPASDSAHPDRSLLPIASTGPERDVSLPPGVLQQAREHINVGIQQAERGAIYASRAEFIKVMRLVTQAFDVQTYSNNYTSALANGLRALEESCDFRPSGTALEGNLNVERLVQTHETPVLHGENVRGMSPLAAAQAYHYYAERQLAFASGHELVAADALYGLAKLQAHLDVNPDRERHHGPLAMSYFQAALMTYPDHFMAANELGVLFARFGQLRDACDVLRFAVSVNPAFPESWLNLSRVHDRLGEADLAERAYGEWQRSMQVANRPLTDLTETRRPSVEWLEPEAFARTGLGADVSSTAVPTDTPAIQATDINIEQARRETQWPFR